MRKWLAKMSFKLTGWQYHIEDNIIEDKQVFIGFEHTSMLDGVLCLAIFEIQELKIHTLMKQELFKGPFSPILKAVGAIPVDRHAKQDIVAQMVKRFEQDPYFNLAIAPEATRAKDGQTRRPIRTGFWHIAKAANVPIVMMFANNNTKKGGIFAKLYPTDLASDLVEIQRLYKLHADLDIVIPEFH